MTDLSVSPEELQRRTILRKDWVPCSAAFIDCRTPGSDRKENYSFIGVGVSQNADQFINLQDGHGFNLGAAGMPNGVTNNLHLHFTAEVFINFGGEFQVRWGADGRQGDYLSQDGDIISVPAWIFRGFTNVGPDEGILLTVLGQDETGGIIWGPSVLQDAESHGLFLTADNRLIDTVAGDVIPDDVAMIKPMDDEEIAKLDAFSEEQLRARVVQPDERIWVERPFLCSELPGGGAELNLVIGYGMSEDRRAAPRLSEPHSFNVAWLRAAVGEGMLSHRHQATQSVTVRSGRWQVTVNSGDDQRSVELGPMDTLSVPAGSWRSFQLLESTQSHGELLVVTGGDGRVRLEWDEEVERAAESSGWLIDPNGYRAPRSVLRTATEDD